MIGGERKRQRQVERANSSSVAKHFIEYNNIIQQWRSATASDSPSRSAGSSEVEQQHAAYYLLTSLVTQNFATVLLVGVVEAEAGEGARWEY
eukprot:COSAG02_NODE_4490_length_5298_cov_15.339104_2_plen_92_part_00